MAIDMDKLHEFLGHHLSCGPAPRSPRSAAGSALSAQAGEAAIRQVEVRP